VFAGGFFAHIFEKKEMVVCALDVPASPHVYGLLTSAECLADPSHATPLVIENDIAAVLLDSWDIQLEYKGKVPQLGARHGKLRKGVPVNPTERASWEIIELVPEFGEFCVGAGLAADWRTRDGILGTFGIKDGDISAYPTATTFLRTWKWKGKKGRAHQQPIADVVRNVVGPMDSALLSFKSRGKSKTTHKVQLQSPRDGGAIIVVLVGLPCNWSEDQGPTKDLELELAHMHATLRLCDIAGSDVRCVLNAIPTDIPARMRPKPISSSGPLDILWEIDRPGKINCTARRLTAS
jgi:hypothetical protein